MNRNRFRRIFFTRSGGATPLDPRTLEWIAEYEAQTGSAFPEAYKSIYNQLYLDLQGLGTTGTDNCFDAYKVIKGSPNVTDGVSTWPVRADMATPTNTPMSEINGGGSYVNIGTDPNVYTRQAAALKCWSLEEIPSAKAYIATGKGMYGSWLLDAIGPNSLYLLGCANGAGTAEISLQPNFNGTSSAFAIHDATYFTKVHGGAKGYFEMRRTAASGAGCVEAFKDGVSLGTSNIAAVAVPDKEIMCCGFSNDNGGSISQTVSGGATPNDGLCTLVDSDNWTTAIGEQFYDSFVNFYTSLGITL